MKKYEGYLIASDLDGTLINSEQYISKQNIDAIESFIGEGGLFAIATGRTELNVLPFIKSINMNCPCILYNGAVIYDMYGKEFVKATYLDKAQILQPLRNILEKYKSLCMQIFIPGQIFIVSGRENIDPAVVREGQSYEIACIEDIVNENWIKILMSGENKVLLNVQEYLKNTIPEGIFHSVFSTSTYLELFANGVSKGSVLKDLMEITGVKREKVIAIGDYCNDIEMIKAAGLGIATANAHMMLKETANITTVSNDDHAIDDLINKILPCYAETVSQE